MTALNFRIRGSYSLQDLVSAIEGEEAYGELLTRLGTGAGTTDNFADFETVTTLPERLAADPVPTDAALATAIENRTPEWQLTFVTTVFVAGKRERIALFRRQP